MGFGGLIVVVVVAWLLYLIPLSLTRRDSVILNDVQPDEPFTSSVTIVRRGTPLNQTDEAVAVVSTPMNRRAALTALAKQDQVAAARRRNVLGVLALITLAVAVPVGFRALPWWTVLVPVGLIVAFLVVARVTVRQMRAELNRQAALIRQGEPEAHEETEVIAVLGADEPDEHEASVDLAAPATVTTSLWDPVPITQPTYVQKPLAARTVRTIDLSAPVPAQDPLPIIVEAADTDVTPFTQRGQRRRAG